jgi:methanogenic corrinoid protein MtbC1
VLTIGKVARLTGIPVATLRAWEQRYGVVTPHRTPKGYRLYDEQAVRNLSVMARLVDSGWAPRDAALRVLDDGRGGGGRGDGGRPVAGMAGDLGLDLSALARSAAAMDARAATDALDGAVSRAGLDRAVDGWLMPALTVLGEEWAAGRVDVSGEHLVTAVVHRRLGAALDGAGRAVGAPTVVVGLPRGSRHEMGVLAFAVLLRRAGLDVLYLGADLPAPSWAAAVAGNGVAAVVLGVPTEADVRTARETVRALRAAHPQVPVHVGGSAQGAVRLGTRPLGHTLADAAATLARECGRRRPSP